MGHKGGERFPLFLGQEIWYASDRIRYAIIEDHLPRVKELLLTREGGFPSIISYEMAVVWENSNYQIRWENNDREV